MSHHITLASNMDICFTHITYVILYAVMLLQNSISQYHNITISQYHNVTISQYHNITISQYHNVTISQYHNITISQYHNITMLQCKAVHTVRTVALSVSTYTIKTLPQDIQIQSKMLPLR